MASQVQLSNSKSVAKVNYEIGKAVTEVSRRLDKIELPLNDATASKNLQEVLETAQGPVSDLYEQRVQKVPTQSQLTTTARWTFINSVHWRVNCLRLKIASQPPSEMSLTQLQLVEDNPDLLLANEPEDEGPREVVGD